MITAQYRVNQILEFRSAADVLRWLADNTQQHGQKYSVEDYYLGRPERHGAYWLWEGTWVRLSEEDYARVYGVLVRYRAFCRHMREVDPEWVDGDKTYWGDNSVEVTQHSRKYPGMTRRVRLAPPSGDACF